MMLPFISKTPSFNFRNLYLGADFLQPPEPEILHILYNPKFTQQYTDFEARVEAHKSCYGIYDAAPGHVMHMIEVPEKYLEDYHSFLIGRYDLFSDKYKKVFVPGTRLHKAVNNIKPLPMWQEQFEIFNLKLITKNGKENH